MSFKTLPFKNLNADAWRNLALAAVAFFYIANFIGLIIKYGVMNGLGGDYLAYWSAGKVAREMGFSHIYNLNTMGQIQFQTITNIDLPPGEISPILIPYLYLSIFVIPFYFLSFLDFPASFWVWIVLNILILACYLSFFVRDLSKSKKVQTNWKILFISLFVSYPVYANLVNGQIELLNVIFCGEFLRYAVKKRPVISGLWLGGLLLKPQLLILIILALMLMKNWKIFQGFMISAGGILTVSVFLSGVESLMELLNLWTDTEQLYSSFAPENMANWRMIGFNINNWTSSSFGWILTILGTLATLALWVILIKKKPVMGSSKWVSSLFAIFAASLLISWHSHIHSSMVLLPFLLITQIFRCSENPHRILDLFVFAFPVALLGGSIIKIILIAFQFLPDDNLVVFLLGLAGIIVYMTILFIGVKTNAHGSPLLVNLNEKPPTDC